MEAAPQPPLRVYIMVSHDVVFKPALLYQLLLRCPGQVVGVGEVKTRPRSPAAKRRDQAKPPAARRPGSLAFWGPKGVAWMGALVGSKKLSSALPTPAFVRTRSTVKRVAGSFGVPYEQVADVNAPHFVAKLRTLSPDVVVSFQHQIFKEEILSVPEITCINCHPAKLPKYRGVKPIFWAMLEGEREVGVTVHSMEPSIDTGRILSQRCFPLQPGASLLENYFRAYAVASDGIIDALHGLDRHRGVADAPPIPDSARYYRHPTVADVARFRRMGLRTC